MAVSPQRSTDVKLGSKETDAIDLIQAKTYVSIQISNVDQAEEPLQTTDLSQPFFGNSFQHATIQAENDQNSITDPPKTGTLHNNEGLKTTQANNNNRERGFRKSQSVLTLATLSGVDDDCSTCDRETGIYESSSSSELKKALKKLQEELTKKEEECLKLMHVQLQTGQEVEELTASLFEEANKMVQDANVKRMATEKSLAEANNKIEVLQAEVTALKALVLTSTPSKPNPHLNPQIDKTMKTEFRGHRRSTSHHSFVKEILPPRSSPHKEVSSEPQKPKQLEESENKDFHLWRQLPSLDASSAFLSLVIREDVLPCLNFANAELSRKVYDGIFSNTVSVEPLVSQKMGDLQHCALAETETVCAYCLKLGDLQTPFAISKVVRNRIIAVCDFVTYIRYIMQGLVKSSEKEVFAEVLQLRKKMCLARLGLEE